MNHIPVFYTEQMSAKYYDDLSPSAYKPEALISYWMQNNHYPIELISPTPVRIEELCLAHEPSYVTKVLRLEIDNGFHNRLPEIAAALPYTSGSMLSATRHVIENGGVACSPTSGFHHAHYDFGGGFCTFNGLMVTSLALKRAGKVNRVGILDCDYHYADGTINIIQHLGIDWITHYCKNSGYQPNATQFLDNLKALMASFYDCDIILYQAGADAHIDDPLGGFLNTLEMSQRDNIVFEQAKLLGIPLVWNLAGGYQASIDPEGKKNIHKILELHTNTLKECIKVYLAD
jgi:acetoin utilization deacetylase AcuC-like enzyme